MKSISHEVLIIADDLTGACDAAVQFAARTLAGRVQAYSTESRDLPESEIIACMESLAATASRAQLIFKKIDSTLRGNVQAEIEAARSAFRCTSAVITPAFPEMGRTVRAGHLYIHGTVARPAAFCLDAVTNEDLDQIVSTGLNLPGRVLWAGSAGLAKVLASRLYGCAQPRNPPSIDGPIVYCIGSDHPATQVQRTELTRYRPDVRIVSIQRSRATPRQIRSAVAGAGALFITGGDTASMVLQAIGARSIIIQQEVVTGVPWGLLSGGSLNGCPVVTKSGGFGAPDTLIKVADFFSYGT